MASEKTKGSKKARLSMARLAAVQCVYQWLQSGADAKDILAYYNDHFTGLKVDAGEVLPPDRDLLSELLQGVQERFHDLQGMITSHLNKGLQTPESKKDLIIMSCLYCGAYELMTHHDLDPPLIISEYLHITRSFYNDSEVKLVNGVLDSIKTTLNR